jgi:hypothetical protein
MIKLKDLIRELTCDNSIWYHGSASGDLRGGKTGLHLGTFKAAQEALHATIGVPVEGEWDGTREYGKTLLCGKNTLKERHISATGFNCDAPDEDFYPSDDAKSPIKLWNRTDSFNYKLTNRPAIKKYKLLCPMTNFTHTPHGDWKANGYMKASLKRGNAKSGFYYKNEGEDVGSISVVVPNGNCVKEI